MIVLLLVVLVLLVRMPLLLLPSVNIQRRHVVNIWHSAGCIAVLQRRIGHVVTASHRPMYNLPRVDCSGLSSR